MRFETAVRRAALVVTAMCAAGCDVGAVDDLGVSFAEVRGTTYAIHVGGVCSQTFTEGRGDSRLGQWEGVVSVDAQVDQRDSMVTATADMKAVLDQHCLGNDACYIFTFSNGGATISRTLALHDTPWNIIWVMAAASNEGGSEIGGTGVIGETFGGCALAGHIGTTDHRAGWNHNDTNGAQIYGVGGFKCMSPFLQCALLPGEDDGAVAFHSSGLMNDTYSMTNLCAGDGFHFANHAPAFSCEGYDADHFGMKRVGVCETGGCQ